MITVRHWLPLNALAFAISLGLGAAQAAEEDLIDQRAPLVIDFIDGAYLAGAGGIVVTGAHGLVGLLKVDSKGAVLTRYPGIPNEDFTTLERWSDNEVLLGTSDGQVFLFDGKTATEVANLSEHNEPVLDIAAANGIAWAVGGRGMLANTKDGKTWTTVEIAEVTQPQLTFPGTEPGEWYFGVSNLNLDSMVLNATVAGKPAVADTDYTLYPDEGFIQFINTLDSAPAPTIDFKFAPGPAFKPGDVSWNVVLFDGTNLTIAGEFGMILQTPDGGQTWVRRDSLLTPREPEPPYWMAGTQKGSNLFLAGAAGVVRTSADGGVTWAQMPSPSAEGLFGITVLDSGQPAVAGAVGLLGVMDGREWAIADRSELQLLSWLKTSVAMPDGTLIMLGGRATVIGYKEGKWTRIPVEVK
jgi:hypothetical protein